MDKSTKSLIEDFFTWMKKTISNKNVLEASALTNISLGALIISIGAFFKKSWIIFFGIAGFISGVVSLIRRSRV